MPPRFGLLLLSGAVTLVVMVDAVTVNDLLDGDVSLDVECLDRIYRTAMSRRAKDCHPIEGYLYG